MLVYLAHALKSPIRITHGRKNFWLWLGIYFFTAFVIFGSVAAAIIHNQEAIAQLVLDYLFPPGWHNLAERLFHFFFESQTKVVLSSLIISSALVVTSAILFPIKEKCSEVFEQNIRPEKTPGELPLWIQALEEAKILVLYGAVQGVILAIGYYPYAWCKVLSSVLGVLFLFFAFGLDFIAPTLQRHQITYAKIAQLLIRYLPVTLLFGAIFSAPLLLIGRWVLSYSTLTLIEVASLLFIANLVFMALAVPAGTYLAIKLQPGVNNLTPIKRHQKTWGYAILGVTFVLAASFHTLVAMSLHHKSQILKCHYDIDWGSFSGQFAGLKNALFGKENSQLQFDLNIHNPTPFDVKIENSRLIIQQNERIISNTALKQLYIPSGQQTKHQVQLDAHINLNNLSSITQWNQGWQVHLEFDLLPGIPFMLAIK